MSSTGCFGTRGARVRDRENLRLERTRLFGRVRRIFLELGRRLHALDLLDDPRDIFYLEVDEVLAFVDGRVHDDRPARARGASQARVRGYADRPAPDDRFETRGPCTTATTFRRRRRCRRCTSGDEREGPRLLSRHRSRTGSRRDRSRDTADLEQRAILVAEHTDPGWIMLFPSALRRAGRARQPALPRGHRRPRAGHSGRRVAPGRHALAQGRRLGGDGRQRPASFGASPPPEGTRCVAKSATRADFSAIRYAQVWEDADVLLGRPRHPARRRLRVDRLGRRQHAGAADRDPSRVIALDLSPAQLACLELRVAAYRDADAPGAAGAHRLAPIDAPRRAVSRCRPALGAAAREFWDAQRTAIEHGIGGAGKFERYFALFRIVCCRSSTRGDRPGAAGAEDPAKSGSASTRTLGHLALAPAVPDVLLAA